MEQKILRAGRGEEQFKGIKPTAMPVRFLHHPLRSVIDQVCAPSASVPGKRPPLYGCCQSTSQRTTLLSDTLAAFAGGITPQLHVLQRGSGRSSQDPGVPISATDNGEGRVGRKSCRQATLLQNLPRTLSIDVRSVIFE